jgi:hypothetical protein
VSVRNKRSAKAARRTDRARKDRQEANGYHGSDLAFVHSLPELADLAERGERLPCGCDAHDLLHGMLTGDGWEELLRCGVCHG